MEGAERDEQLVAVWSNLAALSEPEFHLEQNSMLQLCKMFWRSETISGRCKIYEGIMGIAQGNVVEQEELLLGVVVVLVRGRNKLP